MFSGGFYCSFIWETRKNICANLSWCRNFPDTKLSWPQSFLVLICLQSNRAGAKSFWCHIFLMPNCSGAILSGSKLPGCLRSNFHVAKLSVHKLSWCQIVLVSNCPGAKLSGAISSWCHIGLVPNCPVPNCPVAKLYGAKLYGAKFPLYHLWLAKWIFSTYLASQDALEVMRVTE